jgi:hypothetical protein
MGSRVHYPEELNQKAIDIKLKGIFSNQQTMDTLGIKNKSQIRTWMHWYRAVQHRFHYGHRKIKSLLKRKHKIEVNRKTVQKIMQKYKLQCQIKMKRPKNMSGESHIVVGNQKKESCSIVTRHRCIPLMYFKIPQKKTA